jgi:hypothetical protein
MLSSPEPDDGDPRRKFLSDINVINSNEPPPERPTRPRKSNPWGYILIVIVMFLVGYFVIREVRQNRAYRTELTISHQQIADLQQQVANLTTERDTLSRADQDNKQVLHTLENQIDALRKAASRRPARQNPAAAPRPRINTHHATLVK